MFDSAADILSFNEINEQVEETGQQLIQKEIRENFNRETKYPWLNNHTI